MYHRFVASAIAGILAIIAALAFAPLFQANANFYAANDPHPQDNAPAPNIYNPHPGAERGNTASPEPQTAPAQPDAEPGSEDFDGETTFAMNEINTFNALDDDSDAHIFSALGSGDNADSTSQKHARRNQIQHPQAPQTGASDNSRTIDRSNTANTATDEQASNDSENPAPLV